MFATTQSRLQTIYPSLDSSPPYLAELSADSRSDITYVTSSASTRILVNNAESGMAGSLPAAPALPPLRPGGSLGPFRLLHLLGQGAQGEVWKACREGQASRIVALKVLSPTLARQPNRLAQFRREAERGLRLDGPALLHVFEFGDSEGLPYMVMPFVQGISLLQVIRARLAYHRGVPEDLSHPLITADEANYQWLASRILATAAHALGRIHASRIVHRDIKPANILLDGEALGGVYLCDLGLGRDLEFATADQMRDGAGTPMYMAPERLLRDRADEVLCDIYAMGVTLFETFTLARPFLPPAGMHSGLVSSFLANARPRKPRRLNPAITAELEAIIMKAMSHNSENRHQSARELAGDLERFLNCRKHPAEPTPPPHIPPGRAYLDR